MDDHSSVLEIVDQIKEKKIKGSTDIALAAVDALLNNAKRCGPQDPELKSKIIEWGRMLKKSRTGLITLQNGVTQATHSIDCTKESEILSVLESNVKTFRNTVEIAEEKISEYGSNIIQKGDNVLTISHSKMVLAIIKEAKRINKEFAVWVSETRPRYQGVDMAKELSDIGVDTCLIIDSAIRHLMTEVDIVIVGADTICSDGSIITKIGASQMALAAHEARVPFYVAAPTYKFSMDTFSGVTIKTEEGTRDEMLKHIPTPDNVSKESYFKKMKVRNPSFDVTPPEYIRGIITERYIMSPHSVGEYVAKQNERTMY